MSKKKSIKLLNINHIHSQGRETDFFFTLITIKKVKTGGKSLVKSATLKNKELF